MGNAECFDPTQLKSSQHAYGLFQVLTDKNHQYASIKKSMSKQHISGHSLRRQLQKRHQISSIHLVKLMEYSISQDEQFYHITLLYQYFAISLKHKRDAWIRDQQAIHQLQLANLVLNIENAIHQLYDLGIPHRAVNMYNVLCINSLFKLTDMSMTTFLTGLDLSLQGDLQQFLSPKMLTLLNHKGSQPKYLRKDDLFSLGLMVICLILQCQPKELYIVDLSNNDHSYNLQNIKIGLKILQQRYEKWISKKIKQFLQIQSLLHNKEQPQISQTEATGGRHRHC